MQAPRSRLAETHVETRLLLQERQVRHIPDDDHPQPLRVAVEGEDDTVHGEANAPAVLCDEFPDLSS